MHMPFLLFIFCTLFSHILSSIALERKKVTRFESNNIYIGNNFRKPTHYDDETIKMITNDIPNDDPFVENETIIEASTEPNTFLHQIYKKIKEIMEIMDIMVKKLNIKEEKSPVVISNTEHFAGCTFDDLQLLVRENGRGGKQVYTQKLGHRWEEFDNEIPYHFDPSWPSYTDIINIKEAMDTIANNTCITFRYVHEAKDLPPHHLSIKVEKPNEMCQYGFVNLPKEKGKVNMTFTGSPCSQDLILHELGHVLGLAHTHKRYDRDEYFDIQENCIPKNETLQYQTFGVMDLDFYGIPYMCNSIMHYPNFFPECHVFIPKKGSNCMFNRVGRGYKPIPEDWWMINEAHCWECEAPKDEFKKCLEWRNKKYCETLPDFMSRNCGTTCHCQSIYKE